MKQTLTADIEAFVRKSETRLLAVVRNSLQDVVTDVQTPMAEGGRMRVDTGFLRASGRAATDGFPSGPNIKPTGATANSIVYDGQSVTAVLLDLKLGETFYFGWTADYAAVRELHDGFLETAMQNWQQYVNTNSEKYRG